MVVVLLGIQPVKAWLERDVLAWFREPEGVGINVWAHVTELEAQLLEGIRVELAVWPGGNLGADNLAVGMKDLRRCCCSH